MAEDTITLALELLESRKYSEIRQILTEMEPIDIALLF